MNQLHRGELIYWYPSKGPIRRVFGGESKVLAKFVALTPSKLQARIEIPVHGSVTQKTVPLDSLEKVS